MARRAGSSVSRRSLLIGVSERTYKVTAAAEALSDFIAIFEHIEHWSGDRTLARRTVQSIRAFVRGLQRFPHRGSKRDDLRPGLRIIPVGHRAVVAYQIDDEAGVVTVLRVLYGGQDYAALIGTPPP